MEATGHQSSDSRICLKIRMAPYASDSNDCRKNERFVMPTPWASMIS